jgi:hypothetical protein
MLELHVWGPALGLASIDAECLAIITYLHNALSADSWRLIPTNDPSVSPESMQHPCHYDHDPRLSPLASVANDASEQIFSPPSTMAAYG